MRLFTVVPRTLHVVFSPGSSHHGETKPLLQLQLSCIRYGELNGAPDDLGVSVTYKIHVGVEVPVQVLDAVQFGPVLPSSNRAVACEYRHLGSRAAVALDLAPERPADQAIVAEVLQPQTEA